jgi:AbrB family looped-hinge helix DNA binding protein
MCDRLEIMNGEPRVHAKMTLRDRGQITIPAEVRDAAHVDTGAVFDVQVVDGRIVMTPQVVVDASQAWFWTERWQAMERKADEDYASGRYTSYDSFEDLIAGLES